MKLTTSTSYVVSTVAFFALLSVVARPAYSQIIDKGQAEKAVWSGYWWPTAKAEIVRPLKKYDALTRSKSAQRYLRDNPPQNAAPWEGLCHAWSAASVSEIEPTKPLQIGRTVVGIGDQKAWLTICHDDDVANFYGDRFGDGIGSEDPQDIRPDELWITLRSYLRERKIPLVVDLSCDESVWNYPVYAYCVKLAQIGAGPLHRGTMEIWLADDAVAPDYRGIKKAYKKYQFEVDIRNGSIVVGSGKWIGASVKDHPDFVWAPYVVQTSNPEISYEKVCKLLGRTPAEFPDAPQDEEREEPTPGADGGETNDGETNDGETNDGETNDGETNDDETNDDETNDDETNDDETNGDENNGDETNVDEKQALLREFIESLPNYETGFFFSFAPEGLQHDYVVGDSLRFNIIAESDGYLSVFSVNPDGSVDVLHPLNRAWENNQNATIIPRESDQVVWRATEPIGEARIVAVVSASPLNFDAKRNSSKIVEEPTNEEPKTQAPVKPTDNILGWCETRIYVGNVVEPFKGKKQ